jgi:hypothetical protein
MNGYSNCIKNWKSVLKIEIFMFRRQLIQSWSKNYIQEIFLMMVDRWLIVWSENIQNKSKSIFNSCIYKITLNN